MFWIKYNNHMLSINTGNLRCRKEKKTLKIVREAKSCAWTVKTMKTFFGEKRGSRTKMGPTKVGSTGFTIRIL